MNRTLTAIDGTTFQLELAGSTYYSNGQSFVSVLGRHLAIDADTTATLREHFTALIDEAANPPRTPLTTRYTFSLSLDGVPHYQESVCRDSRTEAWAWLNDIATRRCYDYDSATIIDAEPIYN